jgi:hypothetical protein
MDYKGFEIKIIQDQHPQDPREWDNLGTMACFHGRYQLGDPTPDSKETVDQNIREGSYLYMPVYLYDHSGITVSTEPFSCPWDSGQIGWIYVSYERIEKEYGWKLYQPGEIKSLENRIKAEMGWEVITQSRRDTLAEMIQSEITEKALTTERREQIKAYLKGEVRTYDQFLTGEVYGYQIIHPNGEELDSCCGYYGNSEESGLLQDARALIDRHLEQTPAKLEVAA